MITLFLVFISIYEGQCGNETESESKNNNESRTDSSVKESQRQRESVVRATARAGASEACDPLKNPIGFLRGEVCGSHYKVLGLDRKKSPVDKTTLKKVYRKLSLSTHPDKNGGKDTDAAFNLVQSAYDCLSDPDCHREYNYKLDTIEEENLYRRQQIKEQIIEHVKTTAFAIREGAVSASTFVVKVADDIAQRLEWKVNIFDTTVNAGAWIASSLMFIFCRPVAYALMLSRVILSLNNLVEDRWPQFRRHGASYRRHYFD